MLRVLACYAGGNIRPETYRSLVKNVPIGCLEMINVSGDQSNYWHEFRKRWIGKFDLVTVEQDNVLTPEMLPSFNMCEEPWCVYEYEGPPNMLNRGAPDRMLKTSLGMTRFSTKLQQEVPIEDISTKDYFAWYLIDFRLAVVLGKKGYKPHIHGEVEHLHDYTNDRGRIVKEDELYNEAIKKSIKNPESVLAHPGLETSDVVSTRADGGPNWWPDPTNIDSAEIVYPTYTGPTYLTAINSESEMTPEVDKADNRQSETGELKWL